MIVFLSDRGFLLDLLGICVDICSRSVILMVSGLCDPLISTFLVLIPERISLISDGPLISLLSDFKALACASLSL